MASKLQKWLAAWREQERLIPTFCFKSSGGKDCGAFPKETGELVIDGRRFTVKEARRLAEWILEITRDEDATD